VREDFDAARVNEEAEELGREDGEGSDDGGNEALVAPFVDQHELDIDLHGQASEHFLYAHAPTQPCCRSSFLNFGFFLWNWFHVLFQSYYLINIFDCYNSGLNL